MDNGKQVTLDPTNARPAAHGGEVGQRAMPVAGPQLSVIVPVLDERDNVAELFRRLCDCLAGISWEVIFVDDDSADGTSDTVRELASRDHRIRCVQRIGRRGLSSACVEGMLASAAPYLAVIDGDLQHDETLLPRMLEDLRQDDIDIVIGSRYAEGGGLSDWDESRASISRLATRLSRLVVRADLKDPMSGFFMIRREALMLCVRNLSAIGFKILLDLFASSPEPLRFKEIPYVFRSRQAGESKLDNRVAWDYGMLLLDKLIGHIVPVRFISFTIVGGLGVVVHFIVLASLFSALGVSFVASQTAATLVAMTSNFALNNIVTYRDMRLHGWGWFKGLLSFMLACGLGAFANVGIATYLFREWDAKWAVAAIAGVVVGAVWNYAVTMVYTWKKPRTV